jgi:hypothetical protein
LWSTFFLTNTPDGEKRIAAVKAPVKKDQYILKRVRFYTLLKVCGILVRFPTPGISKARPPTQPETRTIAPQSGLRCCASG